MATCGSSPSGSYLAEGEGVAEAAFAVDDQFQGKGLGTELLERLAAIATAHGFRRFDATTLGDNHAMLEVFRDSGFEVRSKSAAGVVDVTLALTPSAAGVVSAETRRRRATAASLRPMLQPRAVAVVGASRDRGQHRAADPRRAGRRPDSPDRSIRSTRPRPRSAAARLCVGARAAGRRRPGGHRGAARPRARPSWTTAPPPASRRWS